jgi:hypothetical protein
MKHELIKTELYLLVVSDEEVKHGDICLCDIPASDFYDIVPYNGAFATHYYKKIISHRPLNPDHITLNVDLLPPFEEDIKKMAKDWLLENGWSGHAEHSLVKSWMAEFYNKAKETYKYTEEDILNALEVGYQSGLGYDDDNPNTSLAHIIHIKDGYIKSLNKPKLPIAFESETDNILSYNADDGIDALVNPNFGQPKTITNSEGRTEWVGTYIFN